LLAEPILFGFFYFVFTGLGCATVFRDYRKFLEKKMRRNCLKENKPFAKFGNGVDRILLRA